jgi:hypothetical protein
MNNLLKNYFSPTPKRIQKWLFGIKSIIATAAATAFVSGNDKWAFYAMVTGAVLGELGNLFSEDQTN